MQGNDVVQRSFNACSPGSRARFTPSAQTVLRRPARGGTLLADPVEPPAPGGRPPPPPGAGWTQPGLCSPVDFGTLVVQDSTEKGRERAALRGPCPPGSSSRVLGI